MMKRSFILFWISSLILFSCSQDQFLIRKNITGSYSLDISKPKKTDKHQGSTEYVQDPECTNSAIDQGLSTREDIQMTDQLNLENQSKSAWTLGLKRTRDPLIHSNEGFLDSLNYDSLREVRIRAAYIESRDERIKSAKKSTTYALGASVTIILFIGIILSPIAFLVASRKVTDVLMLNRYPFTASEIQRLRRISRTILESTTLFAFYNYCSSNHGFLYHRTCLSMAAPTFCHLSSFHDQEFYLIASPKGIRKSECK